MGTPLHLFLELNQVYNFTHDPCPLTRNPVNCLDRDWGERNFVNPPFNNIGPFFEKAVSEMKKNRLSVFLVPFRSFNAYWNIVNDNAAEVFVFTQGITFAGYTKPFREPMAIVVFDPTKKPFVPLKKIFRPCSNLLKLQ